MLHLLELRGYAHNIIVRDAESRLSSEFLGFENCVFLWQKFLITKSQNLREIGTTHRWGILLKRFNVFHIKNEMLGANFLANFISVFWVNNLIIGAEPPLPADLKAVSDLIENLFKPTSFILVFVMTLIYERPIRKFFDYLAADKPVPEALAIRVRRRALNEPFVLIVMDMSMWIAAAVIHSLLFWMLDAGPNPNQRAVALCISNGLLTVTVAFFFLEHVLQKRWAPVLFPEGGLYAITKTLRIRIRTRLISLLFACNLIPMLAILHILYRVPGAHPDPSAALEVLSSSIRTNALVFMLAAVCLTMLVSRNLTMPFREIVKTLQGVRNGHFDKKVMVTSNDEIGYTGDVINEMTEGLKHRERMQQSLNLAMEVQQNLLPQHPPQVHGLDIAGRSIYCDETGGDYFDYLDVGTGSHSIGIVLGDVSGHGIPSALLMAGARAFLRQRACLPGSVSEVVTDVNRQLARDAGDSGSFVTLFFMVIDTGNRSLRWVRAGHEPAVLYDPESGQLQELKGKGLSLGVDENVRYMESEKSGIREGQIILLYTDGLVETQNMAGDRFGKARLFETLRSSGNGDADSIMEAILSAHEAFRAGQPAEDDITLVVVNIQ